MSRTTTQPCAQRDTELVRIFVWFAIEGLAVTGADTQNNPDSVKGTVEEWLSNLGY